MSQKSIDSFFHARKRPATEELKNLQDIKKACLVKATTITTRTPHNDDDVTPADYYNLKKKEEKISDAVKPRVRKQIDFDEKNTILIRTRKVTGYQHPRTHRSIELTPPDEGGNPASNGTIGCGRIINQLQQIRSSPVKKQTVSYIKNDQLLTPEKEKRKSIFDNNAKCKFPELYQKTGIFDTKETLNSKNTVAVKNKDQDYKTPSKDEQLKLAQANANLKKRLNMPLDKIELKLKKSKKLTELKESLQKLKSLEDERQKIVDKNFNLLKEISQNDSDDDHSDHNDGNGIELNPNDSAKIDQSNARLKKFEKIYLDVLTSPVKGFITPIKGNGGTAASSSSSTSPLMAPKEFTPRKLFSPLKSTPSGSKLIRTTKSPSVSPRKPPPAYQRYQYLIDDTTTDSTAAGITKPLQLPYKYRTLLEIFKSIDSVCSMFFNRCETITFKKLKSGVQRMIRKNFTETHLAQIKHLYPDAYKFYQKKMVNPGSTTKYDYYQLIIKPNVRIPNGMKGNNKIGNDGGNDDDDDGDGVDKQNIKITNGKKKKTPKKLNIDDDLMREAEKQIMNPSLIIERQNYFHKLLLELVKCEHDKFLCALTPPMHIAKEQIKRWHPQFNVDGCPDIKQSELPTAPNVEQFSSAKHVLATATKNLFGTYSLPNKDDVQNNNNNNNNTTITSTIGEKNPTAPQNDTTELRKNCIASVLKGVPKSLLEKIRAKQAAQAISKMTRRPSQDQSEINLNYLPELARFIRNIFITENKNVLELHKVILKLLNSFPVELERHKIKEIIQLLIKETSTDAGNNNNNWLALHSVPKKGEFLKINKSIELGQVITDLECKVQLRRSTNIFNDFLQNIK